eukprot:TRINITY_DN3986_c0_g1_i3.p1 TRINITY_DN3986_c0_g1~~TRINITY_DN3986_c0_g1_i3.p1  ORF type:complete len:971 (-),score=180.16 TRINITY_DN3986_c0_g1_i3:83-2995(-)
MPPVMPYVSQLTGDASFYPPLRKKGRSERSVQIHRAMVSPGNTIDDMLRIATEALPLDADNLATSIHKIAKARRMQNVPFEEVTGDPRWSRLVDEIVENGTAFIWPMRLLSLVAWALSTVRDRRILPLLFDICAKRVSVGAVPQDLSSIAWAVATSRMRDQATQALLSKVSLEAQSKVKEFIPQDIAMCAWAFAKVACRDGRLLRLFADEAVERFAELNGQNISNVIWALATIREMHEPLAGILAKARVETIQNLGPQEFSNIVWSFASLPKVAEVLFRRTAPRVVVTAQELDNQHLANVAWAYAKISHRDDGLFHVLSREAMRSERRASPLNLANFAWAFASAGWHGEMSTRRMGLRDPEFFEWIGETAVNSISTFLPQNCSNLVWSFATMRVEHQPLFTAMTDQVQAWLLRDWDPQHLANVLWSYAKLAVKDRNLFETAAEEIVRRGVDYLSRTAQNISNVVWAYGVVNVRHPGLLDALEKHICVQPNYYQRVTEVQPLTKSSRAQIAMTVLSLHRLGLDRCAWHIFDRLAADGLQAGGEAYCNWLFICGESKDIVREVDVWEQMARTAHTRGLQAAVWNCAMIRCLACGDITRMKKFLQVVDEMGLVNVMSEQLREKLAKSTDAPVLPPRSSVNDIDWRRRDKDEHEWVTNSLGFSLRLNKIEYYKEVGTLHYILKHGMREDLPVIHRAIETFIKDQELWLKLAGDEKGAVLDTVLKMNERPMLVVEVGLYVGYSSTRMASQLRNWGGRVISMEVDPYHAAIARNTIELAGLSEYIEVWVGHSENLIPRLRERLPDKSIDILFFDQQGTKMHLDLDRIKNYGLLSDTAVAIGDNVLRPGAPQFMYWTCVAGPWESQVVSLKEYRQDIVEDWMSISYFLPHSPLVSVEMTIPPAVEQLAHDTDGIRWQSVEQKVSMDEWDSHSQRMRREFASVGIQPYEVVPWQDESGRSRVNLRPRFRKGGVQPTAG